MITQKKRQAQYAIKGISQTCFLQYHLSMSNTLRPQVKTFAEIKLGKQAGITPLVQVATLPKILALPIIKNDSLVWVLYVLINTLL